MQCTSPFVLDLKGEDAKKLPCGHCRACRIARSREWYTRIFHESLSYEDMLFVTLTYDDVHLPKDGELEKEELVKYIKRLRGRLEGRKIKYYCCGEYGDDKGRPHYHCILFNVGWKDCVKGYKVRRKGWYLKGGEVYDSWKKGSVVCGDVEIDSIRYVTDYIHKKLYGKAAEADRREQPFAIFSRGLGRDFCLKNEAYFKTKLGCSIKGVEVGLPRYYAKKLGIEKEIAHVEGKVYGSSEEFWRRQKVKELNMEAKAKLFNKEL